MKGFLLTRQWRDTAAGIQLEFWLAGEHGPIHIEIAGQEAVFFVRTDQLPDVFRRLPALVNAVKERDDGDTKITLRTYENHPVTPLYFSTFRAAKEAGQALFSAGIVIWEDDIRPTERYLMERFVTGGVDIQGRVKDYAATPVRYNNPRLQSSDFRPELKVVSLDIETSMDAQQLYSIGVYGNDLATVFMVGDGEKPADSINVVFCRSQYQCLQQFLDWLAEYDPDVLIGWNIVQFDMWVLETICAKSKIKFTLGRDRQLPHWREDEDKNRRYVQVPGRIVLDGIEILRAAFYGFQSYSLENVAQALLGEGKLLHSSDRGDDITRLFNDDKTSLAKYNLMDCQLVWDIFKQETLLSFVMERSQLTGLAMDKLGGSVAAFDYSYLPLLHRKGYVAPNLGELESDIVSPGGYVMDSQPGIFQNVLVLDFKSLYPSIIRTFNIDPYAFWYAEHNKLSDDRVVPGFNGACFAKDEHLLPTIIEKLWTARDKAKAEKNTPLSQAIKIIMNSFYGVLGSNGCRFFDPRVCSSITLRGHQIIQTSKVWIEEQGYQVIYGDTDSVFVWVGDECEASAAKDIGNQLAISLNNAWREKLRKEFDIESALEIQFETHYVQFLMPTIRGSTEGSKKRYAGIINVHGEERLVFKGLESVRTDWTQLAKQFQEELYTKVFAKTAVETYVRDTVVAVRSGSLDSQLIYRKRLRRKLADYEKNVPPHVQAARKLQEWTGEALKRGEWIEYVITLQGPEPVSAQQNKMDYQHYVDKQLAPVADGVLQFVNLSFGEITAPQLSLFDI